MIGFQRRMLVFHRLVDTLHIRPWTNTTKIVQMTSYLTSENYFFGRQYAMDVGRVEIMFIKII